MTPNARMAVIAASLVFFWGSAALGSGTYSSRPPRPPSSMDRHLYETGKKVFLGELPPASKESQVDDIERQRAVLAELQGRLPRKARDRADLAGLAGRVSRDQVDALRYFLQKRFGID